MERIGGYEVYQSNGFGQGRTAVAGKKEEPLTGRARKASETAKPDKVNLSDKAKNLLKELQKKYKDMDFFVADYETDEEAAACLSRGTGEYSLLISPDELEKMASDQSVRDENLKTLDQALNRLEDMKLQLGGQGQEVSRVGIAIKDNGEVSYFAELEKVSEKQRERIEKQRQDRREEASRTEGGTQKYAGDKRASFLEKRGKRTLVYGNSVEELAEKIRKVDWNTIKEERFASQGSHFDLTT